MENQDGTFQVVARKECWRQWMAIVELFARRHRARLRLDHTQYRALHKTLIGSIRSEARVAEGSRRESLQSMVDIAEPWVTPESLEHAEQAILLDLLARCKRVLRQLDGRPRLSASRRWAVLAFAAVLGLTLTAVLLHTTGNGNTEPLWGLDRVHRLFRRGCITVAYSTFHQRLLVTGSIGTFAAVYMVWRSARTY